MSGEPAELTLRDIAPCFNGLIPIVVTTVSGDGVPNVTYLSRVLPVDGERFAVSNQFMSKSHRNVVENPVACFLIQDPQTAEQFRIWATFEQTLRHGPTFDRVRNELALVAALNRMQDVFRLTSADVYRAIRIARMRTAHPQPFLHLEPAEAFQADHAAIGELCGRISRCGDLDSLVRVVLSGLDELLGYDHSILLLSDEAGERLFTLGSHGYDHQGVGGEIAIGDGVAGLAAQRCAPMRVHNMSQMSRYSRSIRTGFEAAGSLPLEREVPMPGLATAGSQLAVPALSLGQLVGVILVESPNADRFGELDQASLSIVASLVASVIERLRHETHDAPSVVPPARHPGPAVGERSVVIRHFADDGSTFVDNEYLIKGVAGRLLWSLLGHFDADGRSDFTNREMRLDPRLDLPDFRDNFESRLILLKRRLDEREAPIRIVTTGRGRFRLDVTRPVDLQPGHTSD
jgi:adenylate cyclase